MMNDYRDPRQDYDQQSEGARYAKMNSRRTLSTVSFILAIISVAAFQIFFISLPCAAVSIILALISRSGKKLEQRARFALITAAIGAVMSICVTSMAIYQLMHDPELLASVQSIYNYYINPEESADDDKSVPENAQDLIEKIISGEYRNEKEKGEDAEESPASADGESRAAFAGGPYI